MFVKSGSAIRRALAIGLVLPLISLVPAIAAAKTQFYEGFTFFVISVDGEFSGYGGSCRIVETPSGNLNAECKGELSFGDPQPKNLRLSADVFVFAFEPIPLNPLPCEVVLTPSGQMLASCNVHK